MLSANRQWQSKWDDICRELAAARANQITPAMLAEFEMGKEQRDQLRDALEQAERERELGAERDRLLAELEQARAYAASCSRNSQEDSARREAAESALVSAREMLAAIADGLEPTAPKSAAYIRAWLSSAPAPAPCSGCAAARELLVLWYHNRSETESGELIEVETQNWLKEHGE